VAGGGEPGHVSSGSGGDDAGGQGADAGDRADELAEGAEGLHRFFDPLGDLADRGGVLAGEVRVHPCEEGVAGAEAAGQRPGQLGDLRAQPAPGQVRHPRRVAAAGDQRLRHRAA